VDTENIQLVICLNKLISEEFKRKEYLNVNPEPQLAQLAASPLLERLSMALIKAEAAIRLASKAAMERQKKEGNTAHSGNVFW
jgi:hypothetical protein